MSFFEILSLDLVLIDNTDSKYQLAKMLVIYMWEDIIKNAWSKTIEVEQEFPSLVAT